VKVVKLDSMPDLDALVKAIEQSEEAEPIALERHGRQIAVIVSPTHYADLMALEEALSDKLDLVESEEILKDPKWIDWELVQKHLKS
jgi:hypothetical protein